MFRDNQFPENDLLEMAEPYRRWLEMHLRDGTYFGFVAEADGRAVGAVGLMEIDWPPHPAHPSDHRRGYVFNMFVESDYRGRGLARELLNASEQEFARRGLTYAVLHASPMGRPLYEKTGWTANNEMGKRLSAADIL
jgi:GNAT superfamily N-acetyltransferase